VALRQLAWKPCAGVIAGPLTHIFRFDTPVEGYDSEICFPVSEPVTTAEVATHTLREMHSILKGDAFCAWDYHLSWESVPHWPIRRG
jgi:hypothetical protein